MFSNPTHHTKLIQRMLSIGYAADIEGMCTGIASMASQAILSGDTEHFNQRLEFINNIPVKEFSAKYEAIKKEWLAILAEIKRDAELKFTELKRDEVMQLENDPQLLKVMFQLVSDFDLSPWEINRRKKQLVVNLFIQKEVDAMLQSLPKEKRLALEIPQFFEAIMVYQYINAHVYSHLYEPSVERDYDQICSALLASAKLEGEVISLSQNKFSGIYDTNRLERYFASLKEILNGSALKEPFTFLLGDPIHAITVGCVPGRKWFFDNAGMIEEIEYDDLASLSKKIMRAFSDNGITTFVTQIKGLKSPGSEFVKCISDWQAQPEFIELHDVKDRGSLVDGNRYTWLFSAINANDYKTVEELLKNGANVNQVSVDGRSPLEFAVLGLPKPPIIELLLQYGANPNHKVDDESLLFEMIIGNHLDVVELLLQYSADVNEIDKHGNTPLNYAASIGNVKIIDCLLFYGAKQVRNKEGETPLFSAVRHCHYDVVERLLRTKEAMLSLDQPNNAGVTPYQLAMTLGHQEVADLLLAKRQEVVSAAKNNALDTHDVMDAQRTSASMLGATTPQSSHRVKRRMSNDSHYPFNAPVDQNKDSDSQDKRIVSPNKKPRI